MVDNPANHHGTHLHVGTPAEVFRLQNGNVAAVAVKYGKLCQGNGVHRMEFPLDITGGKQFSTVEKRVSVIILRAKTEHEGVAFTEIRPFLLTAQQLRGRIGGKLYGEGGAVLQGVHRHAGIRRGAEVFCLFGKGEGAVLPLAGEQGVVAPENGLLHTLHVHAAFQGLFHTPAGKGTVHVGAHQLGDPAGTDKT